MWTIWCTHNDLIFKKKIIYLIYAGCLRGAYWLRFYSLLQCEDTKKTNYLASKASEVSP